MDTVFFFFKQFSYIIFEGETKIHSYVWKAMSIKKSQPNTVKSQSSPIKINDFTVSTIWRSKCTVCAVFVTSCEKNERCLIISVFCYFLNFNVALSKMGIES